MINDSIGLAQLIIASDRGPHRAETVIGISLGKYFKG
jgi:hypothetical protein